jgi:ABC-type Fe3+/spermidine/putrescine transport system ATPase subunit
VITIATDTSAGGSPPLLRLRQLRRQFGAFAALAGLNLDVHAGELFTLLGPSGCGKTTTLRLVAGFEYPDSGEIWFDDQRIVGGRGAVTIPPHRRNMGMVFQSYAIWPHMTVFENVAYPLRARRVSGNEINRRVGETLTRVGLAGLEHRPGLALSGGQQQRVAMARALVYEPKLLLLDEPFSNLDAKLREQMRLEIKKLLKGLGITVLLVTHDQLEALGMSDRIAVMNGGHIEQVGSAIEVYDNPTNAFVRDFLGRVVLLRGSVAAISPHQLTVSLLHGTTHGDATHFRIDHPPTSGLVMGQKVMVAIRPEQIGVRPLVGEFNAESNGENASVGMIETLLFAGDRYEARFRAGETAFVAFVPRSQSWSEGQKVILNFPAKELSVWPA